MYRMLKIPANSFESTNDFATPRADTSSAEVFSNSGLDYCGPCHVHIGSKRSATTTKTYTAIFVCMASRAVNIELAEDLSVRSFIDFYDRGICAKLFKYDGTQFVGADRQILRVMGQQSLRYNTLIHSQL